MDLIQLFTVDDVFQISGRSGPVLVPGIPDRQDLPLIQAGARIRLVSPDGKYFDTEIGVSVDAPKEVVVVDAWFEKWGSALTRQSEDFGCGCCVHIWQLEGLAEAIAELPPVTISGDEWTH